eukprot:3152503-Amphidinium_carterae.2
MTHITCQHTFAAHHRHRHRHDQITQFAFTHTPTVGETAEFEKAFPSLFILVHTLCGGRQPTLDPMSSGFLQDANHAEGELPCHILAGYVESRLEPSFFRCTRQGRIALNAHVPTFMLTFIIAFLVCHVAVHTFRLAPRFLRSLGFEVCEGVGLSEIHITLQCLLYA